MLPLSIVFSDYTASSAIDTELGVIFHPMEIVQIAISLFAALTDAHKLDIGILDLKRENILVSKKDSRLA